MTIQLVVAVHFGDFTKIIPPVPNMHVRCDATCTDTSLFLSFYMKYNISIYNQFDIPFESYREKNYWLKDFILP